MTRVVLPVLLFLILGVFSLMGACGGPTGLIVVHPGTYDFGRVLKGEQPDHVFTLTNNSDRIVKFTARPNCSCFAVAPGLRPLDPGQSLEFRVLFDTTALPPQEVQGKWIAIHTDHPDIGSLLVPLLGEIYRAYTFAPASFSLGRIDGRPANYRARIVNIRPLEGHTIRFTGSFQMPPVFDVDTREVAGGGLDVYIGLKKDARRPVSPFLAKIRLDLEVVSRTGVVRKEERVVQLDGLWSLPP